VYGEGVALVSKAAAGEITAQLPALSSKLPPGLMTMISDVRYINSPKDHHTSHFRQYRIYKATIAITL